MATGEESNNTNACIKDSDDVKLFTTRVTSSSASSVPLTVPMFSSASSSLSSAVISTSLTTSTTNRSSQFCSSFPVQSESSSLLSSSPRSALKKNNISSSSKKSCANFQREQPGPSGVKTEISFSTDSIAQKHDNQSLSSRYSYNEPLNLSMNTKLDDKQISGPSCGRVLESGERVTVGNVPASHTVSTYKTAHPIGSRKVTENVITYHEPMFQSVANSIFENQKNMGKRKNDEDKCKGEVTGPDAKKCKIEPCGSGFSPSKSIPSSPIRNVKKKCSIENIIERIRTEKTVSRGGVACPPPPVAKIEAGSVESYVNAKSDSVSSDVEKVSSTTNSNSRETPKPDIFTSSTEVSVVSSTSNSPDVHKVTSTTNTPELDCEGSNGNEKVNLDFEKVTESQSAEGFVVNKDEDSTVTEAVSKTSETDSRVKLSGKKKMDKVLSKEKESCVHSEGKTPKKICKADQPKLNNIQTDEIKSSKGSGSKKSSTIDKSVNDICEKKTKKKELFPGTKKDNELDLKDTKAKCDSGSKAKQCAKKTSIEKVSEKKGKKEEKNAGSSDEKTKKAKKKGEEVIEDSTNQKKKSKEKANKPNTKDRRKSEDQAKNSKQKKQKLPIACRRIKREASLNATLFLNILNESPRSSKLESQRSKSDSDLKSAQTLSIRPSQSMTNVCSNKGESSGIHKERIDCFVDGQKLEIKLEKAEIPEGIITPVKHTKPVSKTPSPKRKVSFSDDVFDSVFDAVIQRSIEETEKEKQKTNCKSKKSVKPKKAKKSGKIEKVEKFKKASINKTSTKDKKFRLQKLKKAVKLTITKSPEEIAEKKRKANLARLERAQEFRKTERKVSERIVAEEKNADDSISVSSEKNDDDPKDDIDIEQKDEEIKKIKTKKGALFRAARTHVLVESKTVVENTMPSPRWCECCQSSYYPSQPTQGAQVWRIKQLVDIDSSKSPEPIQSSSNHFIAAHASCEVRPYASPSHVSVIDSTPYVGQIVQHGHIQCSPCSCGHSGVFHHGQCQNCSLGGVSNILPCQRYGNTYSVTYPHTHGSYTHCGCGACYPATGYHHTVGQTLIHQPQLPMTTESPILLHHPVQLQVTHDASHSVSMGTMPHSHTDPSLSHSLQSVPLSLARSDQNLSNLTHMCQLSQGEVTNVSVIGSSSPSDLEIVDVGSKDDIMKTVPLSSQITTSAFYHSKTEVKSKKVEILNKQINKKGEIVGKQIIKKSAKIKPPATKPGKASEPKLSGKVLKKDEKKSKLLLMRKKQKELELKSIKILKKKEAEREKSSIKETKKKLKPPKLVKKDQLKKKKINDPNLDESLGKEQTKRAWHGWSWDGEGVMKKITNIFDGQPVQRKCYNGIKHDDGDTIKIKDCVLVCSGRKEKDIPYVAKVSNFWEDSSNGEMMMTVLWFYRPEHAEGGRIHGSLENEVFAAKHRDETLVACIEDRGYVLTYNEYCRFMAEVQRTKQNLPVRKKVVPDPEEPYPSNRIPPVDINPENVFLCRQVYDIKLKRVLKNPS